MLLSGEVVYAAGLLTAALTPIFYTSHVLKNTGSRIQVSELETRHPEIFKISTPIKHASTPAFPSVSTCGLDATLMTTVRLDPGQAFKSSTARLESMDGTTSSDTTITTVPDPTIELVARPSSLLRSGTLSLAFLSGYETTIALFTCVRLIPVLGLLLFWICRSLVLMALGLKKSFIQYLRETISARRDRTPPLHSDPRASHDHRDKLVLHCRVNDLPLSPNDRFSAHEVKYTYLQESSGSSKQETSDSPSKRAGSAPTSSNEVVRTIKQLVEAEDEIEDLSSNMYDESVYLSVSDSDSASGDGCDGDGEDSGDSTETEGDDADVRQADKCTSGGRNRSQDYDLSQQTIYIPPHKRVKDTDAQVLIALPPPRSRQREEEQFAYVHHFLDSLDRNAELDEILENDVDWRVRRKTSTITKQEDRSSESSLLRTDEGSEASKTPIWRRLLTS